MDFGQHGQNQGPDIWAGMRYASEVAQTTLKSNPTFRCKRYTGLGRPIDYRAMTEVTGVGLRWEISLSWCYSSATLPTCPPLAVVQLLPSQDIMSYGQNHQPPSHLHFPLIHHHLWKKSLQLVRQERQAPCRRSRGPTLI